LWTSDLNAEEISTKLGPHQLLLSENLWESNPNPMVHHHVHYTNMARGWDMFITHWCQNPPPLDVSQGDFRLAGKGDVSRLPESVASIGACGSW
jgi:hypothetical protein